MILKLMFHVEQNQIQLSSCPICDGREFGGFRVCKDYTVSKADFSIVICKACGFALTSPRPADAELGRYYESEEYISHSNTKKGLIGRLYQAVRRRTLKQKLSLVQAQSGAALAGEKGDLLDIGCGTGEFLNTCKQAGWKTIGIEPSKSAREMGRKNYALDVREEDALAAVPAKSQDVITMWHVLEHVPCLNERVQKLKELLRDNGLLVIAVPNRSSHDAEYYGEFWAAYDVPRHLWHFRATDMRRLMENNGLQVVDIRPMKFDSYYVSLLSEKYKNGGGLISAVWRGWISNRKAGKEGWSSLIYIIRHKS